MIRSIKKMRNASPVVLRFEWPLIRLPLLNLRRVRFWNNVALNVTVASLSACGGWLLQKEIDIFACESSLLSCLGSEGIES